MKTILTGLAVFGACGSLRRRVEKSGCHGEFAGGHVRITPLRNEQGAFGLPLSRPALLTLSGAALAAAWVLRRKSPVGAGLLLGGGTSNFCERLREGAVYDYIRLPKAPGRLKRYVFNPADFAIAAGAAMLSWEAWAGSNFSLLRHRILLIMNSKEIQI